VDGQWVSVGSNTPLFSTGNGVAKTGNDLTKNGNGIPASVLENSRAASALVAARGMVQHGVGKAEIDEKIGSLLFTLFFRPFLILKFYYSYPSRLFSPLPLSPSLDM
jgi:hypothetical protein